jgi:hypothetical protein
LRSRVRRATRDPLLAVLGRSSRGRALIFRRMYRRNRWGDEYSRSGAGSNELATRRVVEELPDLLRRFGIRSLVDAPCGDLFWISQADLDLDRYVGIDIVPELINELTAAPPIPHAEFHCLDVVKVPPPRADAILCRDLLVHLTAEQIRATLANFRASGARYLLTTTFDGRENHDITNGRWRALNLRAAPYNFPEPLAEISEDSGQADADYRDKQLALWRIADLPTG